MPVFIFLLLCLALICTGKSSWGRCTDCWKNTGYEMGEEESC